VLRKLLFAILASLPALATAVPFWGSRESVPVATPSTALKHGEFVWLASVAPAGSIVVVVALDDQLAFVYRDHFCRQESQTVHFAMHQPTTRAAQCHAS
jgi:hypothetical protein